MITLHKQPKFYNGALKAIIQTYLALADGSATIESTNIIANSQFRTYFSRTQLAGKEGSYDNLVDYVAIDEWKTKLANHDDIIAQLDKSNFESVLYGTFDSLLQNADDETIPEFIRATLPIEQSEKYKDYIPLPTENMDPFQERFIFDTFMPMITIGLCQMHGCDKMMEVWDRLIRELIIGESVSDPSEHAQWSDEEAYQRKAQLDRACEMLARNLYLAVVTGGDDDASRDLLGKWGKQLQASQLASLKKCLNYAVDERTNRCESFGLDTNLFTMTKHQGVKLALAKGR
ncbi:hypothetical protein IWQ60_009045 [Tieghemiomyces parasiticus]|uniref:Uncharacterized protein n=1 Tax=Tieghemiomyces parasiticus TaxID=78921 RepID=A0A9W8DLV1_9FUNG|nr:hypothetical protein IWQ60_009045 [Tieghemiomyces parasiticus]